jgi:hypothetical protein
MHKFSPFRSTRHHKSPDQTTTTTTTLKPNSKSEIITNTNPTPPTQSINISAPIINCSYTVVINDKDQSNENLNEKQTASIENDNIKAQIFISGKTELMSGEYEHIDNQVDYKKKHEGQLRNYLFFFLINRNTRNITILVFNLSLVNAFLTFTYIKYVLNSRIIFIYSL